MTRSTICFLVIAPWLASIQFSAAAATELSNACRAEIECRILGWRHSPPSDDLAAYAKQKNLETNIAQADFDGDGIRDTAVLLVVPTEGRQVQHIAVCLERKAQVKLHLIREPYCGDGISVARKGQTVHDYETGKNVTYRTNGVHAYCFEKAGGTYLFKNGRFELVVDSD